MRAQSLAHTHPSITLELCPPPFILTGRLGDRRTWLRCRREDMDTHGSGMDLTDAADVLLELLLSGPDATGCPWAIP